MGLTITEKILSKHAGREVKAGELCIVSVDGCMATDTTAPLAIKSFKEIFKYIRHPVPAWTHIKNKPLVLELSSSSTRGIIFFK